MGPCRRQDKVARPRTSDGCDRVRVLACRSCGRGHRCGRSLPDSQSAPPEPCRALRCKGGLAAGLLNHVVPQAELDAKVDWLIGRIVDKSPTAIRRGKYAMRAIASMSFDESIAYTESQIALLAMTEDAKEGLKAFSEKRKPSWPGR